MATLTRRHRARNRHRVLPRTDPRRRRHHPNLHGVYRGEAPVEDSRAIRQGAIEGVAAPETANNAYANAAMVPLLTLGIPSSPTIAVLMGAFIINGLTPGPFLFQERPDLVWAVIASFFIGNVLLLVLNLPLVGLWAKILEVPYHYICVGTLLFCVLGAYSINQSVFDIWVMLGFGVDRLPAAQARFPARAGRARPHPGTHAGEVAADVARDVGWRFQHFPHAAHLGRTAGACRHHSGRLGVATRTGSGAGEQAPIDSDSGATRVEEKTCLV